jgi:hypothetical protein
MPPKKFMNLFGGLTSVISGTFCTSWRTPENYLLRCNEKGKLEI